MALALEFAALDADVAASADSDPNVRLELVAATTLSNLLAKYKRLCGVLLRRSARATTFST